MRLEVQPRVPDPIICGRCGEEIRHGVRGGVAGWLHFRDVDHEPVLGRPMTDADKAEVERQMDLTRTRTVTRTKTVDGEKTTWEEEETYTARELDLRRYRKNEKFRDAERVDALASGDVSEDEYDAEEPLPPVEIPCHPIEIDSLAPRSGIRQVANLVARHGWDLRRLTHSRGPYIGASGSCLSISDCIVLSAIGPVRLDGSIPIAVISWRDSAFDFAYVGTKDGVDKVNATTMKNWIKRI